MGAEQNPSELGDEDNMLTDRGQAPKVYRNALSKRAFQSAITASKGARVPWPPRPHVIGPGKFANLAAPPQFWPQTLERRYDTYVHYTSSRKGSMLA